MSWLANYKYFGSTPLIPWNYPNYIGFVHTRSPHYSCPIIFNVETLNVEYIGKEIIFENPKPNLRWRNKIVQFPYDLEISEDKIVLSVEFEDKCPTQVYLDYIAFCKSFSREITKSNDYVIPYFIKASKPSIRNKDQKIPYTIIQTMKSNNVTKNMYNAIMSWVNKNPEYNYIFFDDEKCKQFLKNEYNENYFHIFNMLGNGPTKADFFRWCYLYKKGGVYLDIDTVCIKPLREYIKYDLSFVSKKKDNMYLNCYKRHLPFVVTPFSVSENTYASRINHLILACVPNLPILQNCIQIAVQNIKECYYKRQNYKYPFYLCGPGVLGNEFNRLNNRHIYEPMHTIAVNQFVGTNIKFKLISGEERKGLFIQKYNSYNKEHSELTNEKRFYDSLAFDYEKANNYVIQNNITISNESGNYHLKIFRDTTSLEVQNKRIEQLRKDTIAKRKIKGLLNSISTKENEYF